jgi:hypothetical protein
MANCISVFRSLPFLLFTTQDIASFSRFRLQSQTRITKRINDTLYKPFSLVIDAVIFCFDMLQFSFRFIVRTCDMKTCEEQETTRQKQQNNKNYETMRHYRQHQQRCMHALMIPNFQTQRAKCL